MGGQCRDPGRLRSRGVAPQPGSFSQLKTLRSASHSLAASNLRVALELGALPDHPDLPCSSVSNIGTFKADSEKLTRFRRESWAFFEQQRPHLCSNLESPRSLVRGYGLEMHASMFQA